MTNYTRTIIENIPNTSENFEACDAFAALERAATGRAIRIRRRGRGPRLERTTHPVTGRPWTKRHFRDLPLSLSERFSLYTEDSSVWASRCNIARFDFLGRRDDGKIILRYKGAQ